MPNFFRWVTGVTAALICALFVSGTRTRAQTSVWDIGDIFAGVGWVDYLSGQYWVFDSTGRRKLVSGHPEILTHPWAVSKGDRVGVSTGCMLSPAGTVNDGALYTTSFHGLTIGRFAPADPHAFSLANTIEYSAGPVPIVNANGHSRTVDWAAFAIETVVFDREGNYYVGGQGPPPEDKVEEGTAHTRPAFIFRFNSSHVREATFQVPNGRSGVDQIDIGSDWNGPDGRFYPTIYYTSEDTKIRVFRPWLADDDPDRYGELQVREITGDAIDGSLYAIRALPPEPDGLPSGFLVASSSDVLRLDRNGTIIRRFVADGIPGQRFALNITPDGQSFWTATYPSGDVDYPAEITPGYLLKFHIASPEDGPTAVVPISAGAVWGMCIKREYTAGINTCYVTDADGRPVDRDGNGEPDTEPCRVPEFCGNSIDEDGDGTPDATDPDCSPPGTPPSVDNRPPDCAAAAAPADLWPANHKMVWIAISGVSDPDGDPVSITATAIQQDEPTNTAGDGNTRIDGEIVNGRAYVRAERSGTSEVPGDGRLYEISFTASDGKPNGTCTGTVTVGVPHDQGNGKVVVPSPGRWNSLTGQKLF